MAMNTNERPPRLPPAGPTRSRVGANGQVASVRLSHTRCSAATRTRGRPPIVRPADCRIGPLQVVQIRLADVDFSDTAFLLQLHVRLGTLPAVLQAQGQRTPIVVKSKGDAWQIVTGFGWAHAARSLRWADMAAIVRDDLDLADALRLAAVEHVAKPTRSPLDRALAVHRLEAAGIPGHEVAELLGISEGHKNCIRRLADLPAPLREALREPHGLFSAGHAILLNRQRIREPGLDLAAWVGRTVRGGWSTRELERRLQRHDVRARSPRGVLDPGRSDPKRGRFRLLPRLVDAARIGTDDNDLIIAQFQDIIERLRVRRSISAPESSPPSGASPCD